MQSGNGLQEHKFDWFSTFHAWLQRVGKHSFGKTQSAYDYVMAEIASF